MKEPVFTFPFRGYRVNVHSFLGYFTGAVFLSLMWIPFLMGHPRCKVTRGKFRFNRGAYEST